MSAQYYLSGATGAAVVPTWTVSNNRDLPAGVAGVFIINRQTFTAGSRTAPKIPTSIGAGMLRPANLGGAAFIYWTRCELQPVEWRSILQQCESNINTSLALDKDDRLLIANWTAEFQLRQVNVTAHYRLEMTRQREHSFRKVHLNTKWKECLRLHNREVGMSKITYYEREAECLKSANSDDGGRRKTVDQVGKEIKKWRKSYKYLSNLCDANNPGNKEESEQCLAGYIKNDNYHATFERLIVLKLEAMSELLERFNSCLSGLEECLRKCFSDTLQNIRTVMVVLNQCYKRSRDE